MESNRSGPGPLSSSNEQRSVQSGGPGATPPSPGQQKIQHPRPSIGQRPADAPGARSNENPARGTANVSAATDPNRPLPVADAIGPSGIGSKITAFGKERRHEEQWSRTPNTTGSGAIHVKTFHCKLTEDAIAYMDQCINEWLDAHPQYEVKFVSSTIGTMTGKLKEPAMFCQVWV